MPRSGRSILHKFGQCAICLALLQSPRLQSLSLPVLAMKGNARCELSCAACSFDKGESPTISAGGRDFAVTPELVELRKEQQKVSGRCVAARPSCLVTFGLQERMQELLHRSPWGRDLAQPPAILPLELWQVKKSCDHQCG